MRMLPGLGSMASFCHLMMHFHNCLSSIPAIRRSCNLYLEMIQFFNVAL